MVSAQGNISDSLVLTVVVVVVLLLLLGADDDDTAATPSAHPLLAPAHPFTLLFSPAHLLDRLQEIEAAVGGLIGGLEADVRARSIEWAG